MGLDPWTATPADVQTTLHHSLPLYTEEEEEAAEQLLHLLHPRGQVYYSGTHTTNIEEQIEQICLG